VTTHGALDVITSLPPRRALQDLRDALTGLSSGDPVRAVFKSDRYGVFAIEGVARTGIGGDLGVGGHLLGSPTRVEGDLLHLTTLVEPPALPADDTGVAASDLAHGDVATAYLHHDAHGLIALTGVVTESDHDLFGLVGSWIVTHDGAFAPRVALAQRLAAADEHVLTARRRAHQDAAAPGAAS
jgi:hypothetical protein